MADLTAKSTHTVAEIDAAVNAVGNKVDKVEGYSLMSEAEHQTVAEVTEARGSYDDLDDRIGLRVIEITEAAYEALATKDANTLYIIPEESA